MATIVWIILFIFMFINNVYNARLNYDDIPKPITVYLSYLPCPNCEKWCANDSNYTCNYTCDDTRTNKNMFYVRDYNNYGNVQEFEEDLRKYVEIRDWWNPNQTFATDNEKPIKNSSMTYIKQLCNNKTTNFTCEQINSFYPLCTLDFKPYEAEMERVCQVLKECNEKQEHNWPDQIKITNECAGFDFGNHRFKDDTDKYWLLDVGWFDKFLPGFGLQCTNGRLIRNYSLPLPTLPTTTTVKPTTTKTLKTKTTTVPSTIENKVKTSKTYKSTKTFTYPKTSTKQMQTTTNKTLIPTIKLNNTQAISQVIAGFVGINFIVVGVAIVGVLAELF
ncbi:hypothetical protein Mgra_00002508 [Meloidogyne graminicola]|uniref:Uncharacterized protein n=1 Tax=Meloidogyne graminicola TaxID=189291 RepID=A0A8S9ZY16_9BILA|nr:hypothetical protein Mgra_00002508 [Meloidogyne graminicola]